MLDLVKRSKHYLSFVFFSHIQNLKFFLQVKSKLVFLRFYIKWKPILCTLYVVTSGSPKDLTKGKSGRHMYLGWTVLWQNISQITFQPLPETASPLSPIAVFCQRFCLKILKFPKYRSALRDAYGSLHGAAGGEHRSKIIVISWIELVQWQLNQ